MPPGAATSSLLVARRPPHHRSMTATRRAIVRIHAVGDTFFCFFLFCLFFFSCENHPGVHRHEQLGALGTSSRCRLLAPGPGVCLVPHSDPSRLGRQRGIGQCQPQAGWTLGKKLAIREVKTDRSLGRRDPKNSEADPLVSLGRSKAQGQEGLLLRD